MHTTLLAHVSAADDDPIILAALTGIRMPSDLPAESFLIGIRNADGVVYRHVEVKGLVAAIRAGEALRRLGYLPESGAELLPGRSARLVFGRPQAIEPFGFARQRRQMRACASMLPRGRVVGRPYGPALESGARAVA